MIERATKKGKNEQAELLAAIDDEAVWKVVKNLDQIDVLVSEKKSLPSLSSPNLIKVAIAIFIFRLC